MSRRPLLTCLLLASLGLTGCHTCNRCRQPTIANRPPCNNCDPGAVRYKPAPTPLPPFRQPPANPPIASIGGPQPATYVEPRQSNSPAPETEQPPRPATPQETFPSAQPQERQARLLAPRRIGSGSRDDDSPKADVPGPESNELKSRDDVSGLLNVQRAVEGVDAGFAPYAVQHYRWLADKGYKTVLNVREPEVNDDEVKKGCHKNGMNYRPLIVSAATLSIKTYEQFARYVNDADSQPTYVGDKDGTLAGAMWYLYFLHDRRMDEIDARAMGKRFGFDQEDRNNTTLILAVKKLSADLSK